MGQTALLDRTPDKPVVGVEAMTPAEHSVQRWATLAITVLPFAGLIVAVRSLWGHGLSATDAGVALGMYVFSGIGVTVGFHRGLAHKGYEAPAAVRVALATMGSLSLQGSVISWVATHRRHHAYTDRPGDPHSPHLDELAGVRGTVRGLWHAHTGWLFDPEKTSQDRWAPDLLKDRAIRAVDRAFPWLTVVSLVTPAVLGLVLTGTVRGAVTAFLWGGLARVFLLHHVTWSINSICHFFGRRPYQTRDESTNNWPLALISFGESWHNTHHAFPSSAIHGLEWWQPDISATVIRTLERLRLIRHVRRPTREQLEAKRIA